MMNLQLRPETAADDNFLRELYAAARAAEIALVPWTDQEKQMFIEHQFQAQRAHYRTHFPAAEFDVILLDNKLVGRLYVARSAEEIHILDVSLLAEYRERKILDFYVGRLQTEASESRRPLHIYLENFNADLPLFESWGFVKIVSEDNFYWLMRWTAPQTA